MAPLMSLLCVCVCVRACVRVCVLVGRSIWGMGAEGVILLASVYMGRSIRTSGDELVGIFRDTYVYYLVI